MNEAVERDEDETQDGRGTGVRWWDVAEPDTLTLGDYRRLRAEAEKEKPKR